MAFLIEVLFQDLFALFDEPFHTLALLAVELDLQRLSDLFEPLDLPAGLLEVPFNARFSSGNSPPFAIFGSALTIWFSSRKILSARQRSNSSNGFVSSAIRSSFITPFCPTL